MENRTQDTGQVVARVLRHEIGDLLQSVYATVAILLERLPDASIPERKLLGDLKHRAELCRFELDAVVDLVCGVSGPVQEFDVGQLLSVALHQDRLRFPNLVIEKSLEATLFIRADSRLVSNMVSFLLFAVCQHAKRSVVIRLESADGLARVRLKRDGFGVGDEQQLWIDQPFTTTKQPMLGLALALARRTLEPGGGRVSVTNQSDGVEVLLESPIVPRSDP